MAKARNDALDAQVEKRRQRQEGERERAKQQERRQRRASLQEEGTGEDRRGASKGEFCELILYFDWGIGCFDCMSHIMFV